MGAGCGTMPIETGKWYRFSALCRAKDVAVPRRSIVAKLDWQDARGRAVPLDEPAVSSVLQGMTPMAETEFPNPSAPRADGWTEMSGVYRAGAGDAVADPAASSMDDQQRSEMGECRADPASAPEPRKVRLATVHFRPRGGKTAMDNCQMYEPLIAEAAKQKADLVVLGETLTYACLGKKYARGRRADPRAVRPNTSAELAKQHNLYIVAGLLERDGHLVYNVAVLIGPDGQVVGKYRKVCLPRGEIEGGIAPGNDYPVFDTRFGKVGMMVCYDGFFPEVARELTNRGAEVIAWPVWGCNPLLAARRACENHVYLVSSTYEDDRPATG